MTFGVLIDGIVATLLLVTSGYCILLDRKLRGMRGAQDELKSLVASLDASAASARASLEAIRLEGVTTSERLQERTNRAKTVLDELSVMTDAGDRVASRIEAATGNAASNATSQLRAVASSPNPFAKADEAMVDDEEDPNSPAVRQRRLRAALAGVR